jgi:putative endonuclease
MKQWVVYLVECNDSSLYCGISNDLKARIDTHNSGKGAKYTRSRLPVKLVWSENQPDKVSAMRRESAIKFMHRSEKLKLVAKE